MRYRCMCFGWYHELLSEARVEDFAAAETSILRMLDAGGMIVHAYRETDLQNPELVGRHSRLTSFMAANDGEIEERGALVHHEVERFLIDPAQCKAWIDAHQSNTLLHQQWQVIELWCSDPPSTNEDGSPIYGRAIRIGSAINSVDSTPLISKADHIGNQL